MEDTLSYEVIGCAMRVHGELGPGLDERLYHEELSVHLRAAGVEHESRPRLELIHRGIVADRFEADLVIPGRFVVELKVLWGDFAPEHFAQLFSYLKAWRIATGLLFDFGKQSLRSRRVTFRDPSVGRVSDVDLTTGVPSFVTDFKVLDTLGQCLTRIMNAHGLGHRNTTYRGLLAADFAAEGVPCVCQPTVPIRVGGQRVGEACLNCLLVEGRVPLMVLALYEEIPAAARATLQTYLRHLALPWGLMVNFGKHRLEVRFVEGPHSD